MATLNQNFHLTRKSLDEAVREARVHRVNTAERGSEVRTCESLHAQHSEAQHSQPNGGVKSARWMSGRVEVRRSIAVRGAPGGGFYLQGEGCTDKWAVWASAGPCCCWWMAGLGCWPGRLQRL